MGRFSEVLRALNNLKLLANFRLKLEEFEGISRAAAHGSAIARQAQCLAIARWEEGWVKPIQQWRQELGLVDPADHETYGLAQQLADA